MDESGHDHKSTPYEVHGGFAIHARKLWPFILQIHTLEAGDSRQRTQWIVSAPFFVESDMAYGVQAADLCICCLNWEWRNAKMSEPTRPEVVPFCDLVKRFVWHGDIYKKGKIHPGHGVIYVPDPYESRRRN